MNPLIIFALLFAVNFIETPEADSPPDAYLFEDMPGRKVLFETVCTDAIHPYWHTVENDEAIYYYLESLCLEA